MRMLIVALAAVVLCQGTSVASEIHPPERGFIQNGDGEKCWYTTTVEKTKYFSAFEQLTYTFTFESPTAMPNDDLSKMMIANAVTRFYKGTIFQADTKFKAHPGLWTTSQLQKKGRCIIASNYTAPKVWMDIITSKDGKYILKVIHTDGA